MGMKATREFPKAVFYVIAFMTGETHHHRHQHSCICLGKSQDIGLLAS